MKRRDFIGMLLASAALRPFDASAEAFSKRPTVGFLGGGSKAANRQFYDSLPQGLRDLGYIEGRDYALADRYADGDLARLPALAQELVRLVPDVIVAAPGSAVLAARQATASIPIVGVNMNDPVGMGLVANEARPGVERDRGSRPRAGSGRQAIGDCARCRGRSTQNRRPGQPRRGIERAAMARNRVGRRKIGSGLIASRGPRRRRDRSRLREIRKRTRRRRD